MLLQSALVQSSPAAGRSVRDEEQLIHATVERTQSYFRCVSTVVVGYLNRLSGNRYTAGTGKQLPM